MAAALGAVAGGAERVRLIERNETLGGILNQCIHNGFGLQIFKEELTGPEYAVKYIEQIQAEPKITVMTKTALLNIDTQLNFEAVNSELGLIRGSAKKLILATGCLERPRGKIMLPGSRPAGIMTAGTAQKYVNIYGYLPGKNIVILGSGDIGLIMARRFTLEGAKVKMVLEINPYSSGLSRNIVQCLNDYHIPLKLCSTVIEVLGNERLEGVKIARVDAQYTVIPESIEYVPCDLLILSVGLIPQIKIAEDLGIAMNPKTKAPFVDNRYETSCTNVYTCGNSLHVHDLVDNVSRESFAAGSFAAQSIDNTLNKKTVEILPGEGIAYTVPNFFDIQNLVSELTILFRVTKEYEQPNIRVVSGEEVLFSKKFRIVKPGEMQKIILNAGILKKIKGTIRVEL